MTPELCNSSAVWLKVTDMQQSKRYHCSLLNLRTSEVLWETLKKTMNRSQEEVHFCLWRERENFHWKLSKKNKKTYFERKPIMIVEKPGSILICEWIKYKTDCSWTISPDNTRETKLINMFIRFTEPDKINCSCLVKGWRRPKKILKSKSNWIRSGRY
jgi:hypothetical protein